MAGKQVWLKIGGVHAQGWFWVNGTYLGHNDCYCGAYKYNVTDLVKPGEPVLIAAKVRNDVPSRKGLMSWIQRFGGLYRSVELEATPAVLIDDAYVVGDLDQRKCTVHLKLRNARAAVSPAQPSTEPECRSASPRWTESLPARPLSPRASARRPRSTWPCLSP